MPPPLTRFTFKGGDLDALADAALDEGFLVTPLPGGDGLILFTTAIIDELRWPDFDDLMHGWAAEFDSDYQGWDAAPG